MARYASTAGLVGYERVIRIDDLSE